MANTYLTRTPTTENINKLTLSCWVKRSSLTSSAQRIFSSTSSEYLFYRFDSNEKFRFTIVVDGSETTLRTERVFRDTSAWYNIVVRWDTTQSTEADRIQIWVNGVRETSFSLATYPALNSTSDMFNSGTPFEIGRYDTGNSEYFDGSLSHLHCCSGYAYDASYFGSTDANGVWKINTSPSVTYGTNGFFILKDGNSVTDQSGEGNNFTVGGGTLTNTEDSPSNVFVTANPLNKTSNILLANGNCSVGTSNTGTDEYISGTIAFGNGKYYWENKITSPGDPAIGIVPAEYNNNQIGNQRVMYHENGTIYSDGLGISSISTGVTYTSGDIISVAFDTENGIIKWYKNNTLVNNSTITNSQLEFSNKLWVPIFYCANGNGTATIQANFGNGYFGTTAVASAGTNASGNGIFEYDVPTGYTALCTKGLNGE